MKEERGSGREMKERDGKGMRRGRARKGEEEREETGKRGGGQNNSGIMTDNRNRTEQLKPSNWV